MTAFHTMTVTCAVALALAVTTAAHADLRPDDGSSTLACLTARGLSPQPAPLRNRIGEQLRQKDEALRQQSQAACDRIMLEQAVKQRAYDVEKAQREAHARDVSQRWAEQQARAAEQAKEQARIQALPINRLRNGYRWFAYVTICHQVREGYLLQYVNDVELARAHDAVKAIEARAVADDSSIDTDRVWQAALDDPMHPYVIESACRRALVWLLDASPQSVWTVEKP
jgi:hypothetical protein